MEEDQPIPALEQSSRIKRALRKHLKSLGFGRESDGTLSLATTGKQAFRDCHASQKAEKNEKNEGFLNKAWPLYREYFASGSEITPELIKPALELVEAGTWQSDLFRLATLTWSVPVSSGYGRRMRFLVWDKWTGSVLGFEYSELLVLGGCCSGRGLRATAHLELAAASARVGLVTPDARVFIFGRVVSRNPYLLVPTLS